MYEKVKKVYSLPSGQPWMPRGLSVSIVLYGIPESWVRERERE